MSIIRPWSKFGQPPDAHLRAGADGLTCPIFDTGAQTGTIRLLRRRFDWAAEERLVTT
jgi:hypothetical protein